MNPLHELPALGGRALSLISRRLRGRYDIDEWGLDPELIDLLDPILGLRWDIEVDGADRLPTAGGALLLHNRGIGFSERWVLARGVRRASGRFVRTTGIHDVAPIGPIQRRLGVVADDDGEIIGLLRAGQLVGLPFTAGIVGANRSIALAEDRLGIAHEAGVPIVPVALIGHELARRWTIIVGEPIPAARTREHSEAAVETAATIVHDLVVSTLMAEQI